MDFEGLLKLMVEKGASDLFITAGVPPSMKVHGARNSLNPANVTLPSAHAALAVFV
jgi:twitching motility protein PilU